MNPAVSIILPTFARRHGGYLERAIKSVLAQTFREFEFLIVDDGSTDGSADIIDWYTRQDSRIRHVRFEQNVGLPALTMGLAYAQTTGDNLAFIFDDCTVLPHHLERLTRALDANPSALMAYGQAETTWMNGGKLTIGSAYDPVNMLRGNNHIPNVGVILRREAIDAVGWYDPHVLLKRFCDWDLWVRIATQSLPIFVPEILAYEHGTKLPDSLGQNVTVIQDLMLRYSRTSRTEILRPDSLSSYDPFRTDILTPLSAQDRTDLDHLIIEHFLSVGNNEALLARFERGGTDEVSSTEAKVAILRARYLDRRAQTLATERNTLQAALWSTPSPPASDAVSELEIKLVAEQKRLSTARQAHQSVVASLKARLAEEASLRSDLESQLHLLRSSISWRITRPVRGLKRLLKGQRPKLARAADEKAVAAQSDAAPSLVIPKQAGPMRVVAVGDATASSELCVHWPLQFMAQHLGVEYTFYDVRSPLIEEDVLERADILLLMRCFTPACVELVYNAKQMGTTVVYMTDDDFESLTETEPASAALTGLIQQLREIDVSGNIREMATAADSVIVFSEQLQERFSKLTKTFLAPAMAGVEFYDQLPNQSRPPSQQDEIRIGYSGSPTHDRDVALVTPSLKVLLDKHPRLIVESIGQRIEGLAGHSRYRHFDHVAGLPAFSALQHERSWDIGLSPLEITPFNEAKTDNKFRSYGAAGIPAVYTRIKHFTTSIEDWETGLLVDNNETAWTAALDRLIEDRPLRQHVAKRARDNVRSRFGIASISHLYRRLFAEAGSGIKVLVLAHLHIATVHLDVRIPFAELRRHGVIRYRMRETTDASDADFDWADVLIIVRACEPGIAEQIGRARKRGVKVVFSWDDDFFNIPAEHSDLRAHYSAPDVRSTFEYILRNADMVRASTSRLADASRRYTDRVITAPGGFDMSLLPAELLPRDNDRIRIGYFGSLGRGSEFACVMDALRRICAIYPQVDLEFFGYLPKDIEDIPRIHHLAFTDDYENSIRMFAQRQWDIGLAPLAINDFNRAKNPTKYRDYGAIRAAGIYTEIEPYQIAVKHGVTGLLTENTSDGWFKCLDELIRNPTLRRQMADAAFDDVSRNHSLETVINGWMDVLRAVGFSIPR